MTRLPVRAGSSCVVLTRVRPHLRRRAPSREAGLAGAIILVVRDVVAGWWGGVMARRGDGGRRGSDHTARMSEDQVVPASGPGPVALATNSRTA